MRRLRRVGPGSRWQQSPPAYAGPEYDKTAHNETLCIGAPAFALKIRNLIGIV